MSSKSILTKKAPKLRFPGFSGEWEEKKLGKLIDYKNGEAFEQLIDKSGQYKLITLNSIDINGKLKKEHKKVTNAGWYLKKHDLIMVLSDVAHGDFLGLVDVIPQSNKYVLNQRMGMLRTKDTSLCVDFLRDSINIKQGYFKRHGQGSSQQNLSKGDILKFPVSLPSELEQQKIAGFLGVVDERIAALAHKRALLQKYKKGLMQKIFSQKLRFKDENGQPFPAWHEKKLGHLIDFLSDYTANGSFASLKTNVRYYSTKEYAALVRATDLEKPTFIPQRFADEHGYNFLKKTSLFGGEIIMANVGDVGKVYKAPIYSQPMTLAPNTYVIKFVNGANHEYMYQWMITDEFRNKVLSFVGGGGLTAINKTSLRSVIITLPNAIREQQKIADFLTSIDHKIEAEERKLEMAKQFKKALLQQMFV